MPLARKIDKTTFDALNDAFKAEYKEKDGSYFLDVDDAAGLQSALDRQKEDNRMLKTDLEKLRTDLAAIQAEKAAADADKNRKNKDYDALEADFNRKLEAAKTEATGREDKYKATIQKMLVDNKALEIATDAFGENAEIMLPHIKARLQANFDGDEPVTRVLDSKGQASASSLDELKKEFVDNPRYSSIVVGTRATGGNANDAHSAGGKAGDKKPQEMTTAERTHLYNTNPTEFARLFPQAAVS
jgi:chromosome segregation ATPase